MKLFAFFLFLLVSSALGQQCLPDIERMDCHPDPNATPEKCVARGCISCLADVPEQNVPSCHFPKNYGYTMVGQPITTPNGFRVQLERISTDTLFGGDSLSLTLDADYQSDYRLRIKITDTTLESPRWEVPLQIDPPASGADNPLYDVIFTNVPVFSFKVIRKSSGTTIFDTSLGGFTFADQFIQLGIKLPSRNVYGIGENEQPNFRHSFDKFPRWPLWAKDQAPDGRANMYGVQPHYTVLEEDGNAHAVAIVNSNAQEFEMHPHPGIVYRTTGGILDIYIFLGPTPENTVQQYTEAVGRFPLPPYWSLGFQLCKYGYNNIETLKDVVDKMIQSEIPYDVQYGDIDIMDRDLDFTISPDRFKGLPEYVKELKTKGIKFMTILDPCISIAEPKGYRPFELGEEMDVWVKKSDGKTPVKAHVWPEGSCYFPDYNKNETKEWWKILIKEFHDVLEFDALWIDMNEPANFVTGDVDEGCSSNSINNPPYMPHVNSETLFQGTLCLDHVDSMGQHYNTHSLYGWAESSATAVATNEAVGKRTFALSRSTFLGSGRWLTHWLGDNFSNWYNMYTSIIGVLQFNQFGMPFVGPDICGHNGESSAELCQRWMQLGAFYPFSRNHNSNPSPPQDPTAFNGTIIESSKIAMNIRYTLLPYLYTLLATHEMYGNTVARALWHEFPGDGEAAGIDRQFLWGSGLYISPVLDEGQTLVRGYFPDARFYDYYTGAEVTTRGGYVNLSAPLNRIPLHVIGGNVLPTQKPAVNTELSRQNPFGLIIALDDEGNATGSFYYDAGDSINPIKSGSYFWANIEVTNGTVNYTLETNGYPEMGTKILDDIKVMGAPLVSSVKVNGVVHQNFTVTPSSNQLDIFSLRLSANSDFIVEFQ